MPDLQTYADQCDGKVRWYKEKASGVTMDRPIWKQLEQDLFEGKVQAIVVWRLDRLGRTASGLTTLFDLLQARKVNLISLKDTIDLSTASGRLFANMLASIAAYESELRGERVRAGQAKARAAGKKWGGTRDRKRLKVTLDIEKTILRLNEDGVPKTRIAKTVNLSRQTIYDVLRSHQAVKQTS